MRKRIIPIGVILLCLYCSPMFAESAAGGGGEGDSAPYEKAISEAKNSSDEALLRKKLGDYYVSKEDYRRAASEYVKALSLSSQSFTAAERLQMAVTLSWANYLDDAVRVLRELLAVNQNDRDARIQLARVLSWSDKLDEAAAEADVVLKNHPEDQAALVIKANTLRWRGDSKAAIPVYEKALAQGEDFEARIGLAYAYLDIGEKDKAQEISRPLKPLFAAQEKELTKFSDSLCGVMASHIGLQYSYYNDSDDNIVNRTSLSYGFWAGKWETEISYRQTDGEDPLRDEKAEDLWINAHTQAGKFGAGAGIGMSQTDGSHDIFVGQANANTDRGWWTIGVGTAREFLSDTAQLIQNRIVQTSGALNLSEKASPRLTFTESYTYSGYSDSNDAGDMRLGARYEIPLAPFKIATGYRFRYWDFRRQSEGGYFDPSDFLSQQVFVSLYAETNGYYAYLEPYVGHQAFTRYGAKTSNTFAGGSGSVGWKMKKCTSLEISGEGGNYAGGSTSGFNYYQVGFRLIVNF